jgi:hypothetical protein
MRVTRTADAYVVETRDERLRAALDDLYFAREGDLYFRRFPAGTLRDAHYELFAASAEQLLRQAARLEPAPWEVALAETSRRLDGVDWWLTGSAALAVRGLPVTPRDLDLVVSGSGAEAAFADVLIEPVAPVEGWFCRWFGRAFLGMRVEWVGDVLPSADDPEPTDFGLVAAASLERVEWAGLTVRVPPLALQRAVSERRGLDERVRLIDRLRGRRATAGP